MSRQAPHPGPGSSDSTTTGCSCRNVRSGGAPHSEAMMPPSLRASRNGNLTQLQTSSGYSRHLEDVGRCAMATLSRSCALSGRRPPFSPRAGLHNHTIGSLFAERSPAETPPRLIEPSGIREGHRATWTFPPHTRARVPRRAGICVRTSGDALCNASAPPRPARLSALARKFADVAATARVRPSLRTNRPTVRMEVHPRRPRPPRPQARSTRPGSLTHEY